MFPDQDWNSVVVRMPNIAFIAGYTVLPFWCPDKGEWWDKLSIYLSFESIVDRSTFFKFNNFFNLHFLAGFRLYLMMLPSWRSFSKLGNLQLILRQLWRTLSSYLHWTLRIISWVILLTMLKCTLHQERKFKFWLGPETCFCSLISAFLKWVNIWNLVSVSCFLSIWLSWCICMQDYITRTLGINKEDFADSNHVVLLFSSEKCVVSESAEQLMELVHQTLKVTLSAILICAFCWGFCICFSLLINFLLKLYLAHNFPNHMFSCNYHSPKISSHCHTISITLEQHFAYIGNG